MKNSMLYEHPLNERNRILIRLECLFNKVDHFLRNNSSFDTFVAVRALTEIITMLERNDINTDLIKELDRYYILLTKFSALKNVNKYKLDEILERIVVQKGALLENSSKYIKTLRNDELLNLMRQKMYLSNNLCAFDIPGLYYWLHKTHQEKIEKFNMWLTELKNIKCSINLVLEIIRNSGVFEAQIAEDGFFQRSLTHNIQHQIIRILLPKDSCLYPEISGNKHRVTVRFLEYINISMRPQQKKEKINFQFCCCSI